MRLVIDLSEPAGECVFEVTSAEADALRNVDGPRPEGGHGKLTEQAYELRRIAHMVENRPGSQLRQGNQIPGIPARIVER